MHRPSEFVAQQAIAGYVGTRRQASSTTTYKTVGRVDSSRLDKADCLCSRAVAKPPRRDLRT
ncbi:MAG: hypothetical protein ACRC8S_14020 [Fimbriiglobus sp.]